MIYFTVVVEDLLSQAVAEKIIDHFNLVACPVFVTNGFGKIKKNIHSYYAASLHKPYFVLTDLDTDKCAPLKVTEWLGCPIENKNFIFRIAVTEIESWILSDRENFSNFLAISISHLPLDTDSISDPKALLLNLVKKSRHRKIKEALLPKQGSTAIVGPDYNGTLTNFVQNSWKLENGIQHSDSLNRAFLAFQTYAQHQYDIS